MKQKTKKILSILGVTFFGIFIVLGTVVYIFLDCMNEKNIKRNTLYCYVCIDSNVRNFPLMELVGEPDYYVNQRMFDGDEHHPAYSNVSFLSRKSAEEIRKMATIYAESREFKKVGKYKFKKGDTEIEVSVNSSDFCDHDENSKNKELVCVTVYENYYAPTN